MMKIGIVGSRTFDDYDYLKDCMDQFDDITEIVSGGAAGADTLAEHYANENDIPLKVFLPDYTSYGKKAPLMRNTSIVNHSNIIVAFWDGVSRGTMDTVRKARSLSKQVVIFRF